MGNNSTVNPDKVERYRKLVCKVNHTDKSSLKAISLEAFPDCEEVNLWAYWEGGVEHLDTDILLVGQDWGPLSNGEETIVPHIRAGVYSRSAYCYMDGNKNKTNWNLCELFKILDSHFDLLCDRNTYSKLFFTNFIPWYRTGDKISGGLKSSWINAGKELFIELVDIIQPKVILCLGKAVFQGVLKSADADHRIRGSYNDVIRSGPVKVNFKQTQTLVFPLAHCGTLGTLNRNKEGKGKPSDPRDLQKQKQDWAIVKRALNDTYDF